MNYTNLFKIALKALAHNKMRAFLTMLGIIIGVASVITMIALGQGTQKSIQKEISSMGSNIIMIHPGGERRGGVRLDPSEMQTLKIQNFEALKKECMYVAAISPYATASGQLVCGNNNYPTSVTGAGIDYIEIRQLTIEDGTMFTGLFEANPYSHEAVRQYRKMLNVAAAGDIELLCRRAQWWWKK